MKGQRSQWFGHAIRREKTNEVTRSIKHKPTGRRPRTEPRNDELTERIEVTDW